MDSVTPTRPARRSRRILRWTALAVGLVLLVLAAAGFYLFSVPAGRRYGLSVAAGYAHRHLGVEISAGDFRLRPAAGELEIRNLEIAAPGHSPLLRAEVVVLEVEPGSLFRTGPMVVRRIAADGVTVDLGAPFPELPAGDHDAAAGSAPLPEVNEFALTNGRIVPGPMPPDLSPHIAEWGVSDLALNGSLTAGSIRLHAHALATLRRPGGAPYTLFVGSTAAGPADGPWQIGELTVRGEGFDLKASGLIGTAPGQPGEGSVAVTLNEPPVAPELAGTGQIRIQGRADARTGSAAVSMSAPDAALEALAPFLGSELFAAARLAGTRATVEVSAEAGPGWLDSFLADVQLEWRGHGELLARGSASARRREGTPAIELELDADLLPRQPGHRRLAASATVPDPEHPDQAVIRSAIVDLNLPDLPAADDDLRRRWPALVPDLPAELPLVGGLDLSARLSGPAMSPQVAATARWLPEPGTSTVASFVGQPTVPRGRVTVAVDRLPLHLVQAGAAGIVSAEIDVSGDITTFAGQFTLDGSDLRFGDAGPILNELAAAGGFDQGLLTLDRITAAFGETRVDARGRVGLELPVRDGDLTATVANPFPGMVRVEAELTLADGVVTVPSLVADTSAGPVAASLIVPLGSLAAIPDLAPALAQVPVVQAEGPVFAEIHIPDLDTATAMPLLRMEPPQERIRGELHAAVWLDPAAPALATGTVRLARLTAAAGEAVVTAEGPVEITLTGGTATLRPVRLATPGARLELAGRATLDPAWTPEQAPDRLIAGFAGTVGGSLNTALANPFLEGGVARGPLFVAGEITGTPANPTASLALAGPGVEAFWPLPYPTRITEPTLQIEWADGRAEITTGFVRVNGGTIDMGGTVTAAGEVDLALFLADLRYRLDYGLMADLSGDLRLRSTESGMLLSGRVVLDRGTLDRDIDLDRELLAQFLAPTETAGTEADPLEALSLDLSLETVHGVRVRNNLADLLATWAPLSISGTALNPVLRGRVDVERGGLVFAYGQTLRIDRGRMLFTGDPFTDPVVEFATTSSLQDPTIAALPGDLGALDRAEVGLEDRLDVAAALTSGVAGYVGERLGSRIAQSLGLTQVSVRPVMVFGETDPSARLTVTQDLTRHASFAVSLDLRNTERQVYLLDLHGFRRLPRLTAQLFTTDEGREGTTLQQVLELGGTRRRQEDLPVLRRLVVPELPGVSARTLRRAVRLRRGQPVPAGASLDVELDTAQWLRDRGFPEARVAVTVRPVEGRRPRVDMEVMVEPGPRAEFRFVGDRPPRWARRGISALYRADVLEVASLDEMRRRTVRVFRTLGHLEPRVDVTVEGAEDGRRIVTVTTTAGERVALSHLEVAGLPAVEAALLAGRFQGTLERAELAAGTPDSRRRAHEALRSLGYQEGRVDAVALSPDGRRLTLAVEAGPQARLAGVEVTGVHEREAARLRALISLSSGDPARRDLLTAAALTLEEELLAGGYPDARVRTIVGPAGSDEPGLLDATFEVAQGPRFTLGEVSFQGLRGTRPAFARRVAELEPGEPFRAQDLGEARSRLFETGVFTAVAADPARLSDGTVRVTLAVEEKPRWVVGYGLRVESGEGTAGVVDVVDHNFLGRALTAGTRLLYENNRQSGRLYLRTPGLRGLGASIETFAERRRVLRGLFQEDVTEAALQLSRPLTRSLTGRIYARWADTLLSEREPDPFFPFPDIRIRHPYLGIQLVWDTRDSPFLASHGAFASLDLSGSGTFLGSDFRYVRAYGQLNTFRPVLHLGEREVVWAQSVRAGLARAFDQILLSSVRFYAGGEFSVRGYPTESLGPTEWDWAAGRSFATGGELVAIINQELRVPLLWDISGLVFVDAGQVWGERREFPSRLATSTGFGFRAMTPVGVLRLDLAFPLDRRPEDPRHRIYAGFGTTF